jgi:signal transduction histidine kinase
MAPLSDGLAARVVVILLIGLVLIQGLVAVAMLGGPGRQWFSYSLPLPNQIVAIIQAVEPAQGEERDRILAALNSPTMSVILLPDIPPRQASERASPLLERMLRDYTDVLAEREFRIDAQRLAGIRARMQRDRSGAIRSLGPLRMLVRLDDGSVLQFRPSRSANLATFSARVAAFAAIVGVVVVAAFLLAIRQTSRPMRELANSANRFAREFDTPDLPESGPREIRELSTAFNGMKRTIRGLVHERTRILAAIAHDMRTYLTRLRLRIDFINDPDQAQRAGRDLDEMSKLLEDTLFFAREATSGEAGDAVADVGETLNKLCESKREIGLDVTASIAADTGAVRMSPVALTRVADNLIENAIRYGKRARVFAQRQGDAVQIAVEDEGPGIPEEQIERIVRPFERLEESRHRDTGGTGLGLAIVKTLVEKVGGRFELENRPAGGLRCRATLPSSPLPQGS